MKKNTLVIALLIGVVALLVAGAFVVGARVGKQEAVATASALNGVGGSRQGNGSMRGNGSGQGSRAYNGDMMGTGTPDDGMMENGNDGRMGAGNGYGNGMNGGYGSGMSGNYGNGMNDGDGNGMMGNTNANVSPLTIAEAQEAVEAAMQAWGNPNLVLGEVMIFDNQAYAEIMEKDTGIGAVEVLVDPVTRQVFPEYGPNMMWNLKYRLRGMGSGMMNNTNGGNFTLSVASNVSANMPITPEEARQKAQAYLDANGLGLQAGEEVTPFYGYYTIHTEKGGQIVGMLSVNGYTGAVFPHNWHGQFITMSGE